MDNVIYRDGVAVGVDCGDFIVWFSSDAILKTKDITPAQNQVCLESN